MTARFGRNKRRAAREAVAQAEARAAHAEQYYRKLYEGERRERHDAQAMLAEVVERIIRAVGPQSALIPTKLQPLVRVETFNLGTPIRWQIRSDAPDVNGFPSVDYRNGYSLIYSERYVDVMRLVAVVENDPSSFRTLIRFVSEPSGGIGPRYYMISRQALERVGWRWDDLRFFVEDIVHQLATMRDRSRE